MKDYMDILSFLGLVVMSIGFSINLYSIIYCDNKYKYASISFLCVAIGVILFAHNSF